MQSSHWHYRQIEQRTIEPNLSSIGVVDDKDAAIPDDMAAVIIVDGVFILGSKVNATMSVLSVVGLLPTSVPVFGYVWARTDLKMV